MTKDETIIAVLEQRLAAVNKILKAKAERMDFDDMGYFEGKRDGYLQAIDLLKSITESIEIEIKP